LDQRPLHSRAAAAYSLAAFCLGVLGGWSCVPRHYTGLVLLAFAAFLALIIQVRPGFALWIGLLFGLGWFGVLISWMSVVGTDAWVGLALVCAIPIGLVGWVINQVSRLPLAPVWMASAWVGQEWIRDRFPLGGFPWGGLSFATAGQPHYLFSFGGPLYVSFAFALACSALAIIIASDAFHVRNSFIALALIGITFLIPISTLTKTAVVPSATATIAIVQGGVPGVGLDFLGRARTVTQNHARETAVLATDIKAGRVAKPNLVVWPENSTDLDPRTDPQTLQLIQSASAAVGVPILVGAVLETGQYGKVTNSAVLFTPSKVPEVIYTKQRPVPFGEYLPYRDQISGLSSRFQLIANDFQPGSTVGELSINGLRLGVVICFEVAHDDVMQATVRGGAQALIVMTNNATYSQTDQPEQQFAITTARAIEFSRPVLTAATTGISAAINAQGEVVAVLPQAKPGYFVANITGNRQQTSASVAGPAIGLGLVALGMLGLALTLIMRVQQRLREPA